MDELRFAKRRLLKRPAVTFAGVLTLATGIGAAAATWSLLSAVLLRPLPIKEPERLQVVGEVRTREGQPDTIYNTFVYPFYPQIRDSGVFESVAAQSGPSSLPVSIGGITARTSVGFASHDFFKVLGIPIRLGGSFTQDNDRRGAAPVAILTDRYWRRTFNADSAVVGRTITVSNKPVTIVGVAVQGFRGLDLSQAPDLYLPLHTIADLSSSSTNYFAEANRSSSPTAGTVIIGRLRTGESAAQASTRLANIEVPTGRQAKPTFVLTNINTAAIPPATRAAMSQFARLLGITVGLLLLIGCGTVGMLMLVRTEARRDEFAVCMALGASRRRLARGVALEGVLLAAVGAVVALPVAWWLFWGARAFQLPGNVNIELLELTLDGRTLIALLGNAVLAVIMISVIAGVFGFSADRGDGLRSPASATPRLRRRTRPALVAGQVAVALVLLAGTGLFARSLLAALSLNSGLDTSHILTGSVNLYPRYDAQGAAVFFDALYARLSANPAIDSLAFSVRQGAMSSAGQVVIEGEPRRFPSAVWHTMVNPDYFRMMGVPLIKGRDFSKDDREKGQPVTIVSESFGRMLANGGNPLGTRITMWYRNAGQPADVMEVVGVVGDVVTDVSVVEPLDMYFPIAQMGPVLSRVLAVRPAGDLDFARREIINTIKQIDPLVTPDPLQTLEERIGGQMGPQRFGASVMGALGVIAILLTLLGIYVLAESMALLRMREMGIRAALGATRNQLGAIVLAETVRLVGIGLAVGLLLIWAGSSTIRAFLFRVQPLDPSTLVITAALILLLAIVVSLRPALRVAYVDISRALRGE